MGKEIPNTRRRTTMYKDFRYINAGENEFYRYGRKARERMESYLTPNKNGFYSMPADGGKYYTIGTNKGRYGEFASFDGVCLSVNSYGFVWAKVGTEKAETFIKLVKGLIEAMMKRYEESAIVDECEEE